MRILAINPGSTSTKIAVFEDEQPIFKKTIRHSAAELAPFATLPDQYDFRKQLVLEALTEEKIPLNFSAVVGRGGIVKPIPGGVYEVNEAMKRDIINTSLQHACNLGGLIAAELALDIPGCKAFIADSVVTDELDDIARVTGSPLLPKVAIFHALNQKAVARKYAKSVGKKYEDLNLVVAHMGGGVSVGAHKKGRVIDVNNALNGDGPFSPERAGTLPAGALVDLCFSGNYTKEEIGKMLCGKGGLMAHFESNDADALTKEALAGNKKIALVIDAMIYATGKEIGAMCAALSGEVDAIILTGGIAYDTYLMPILEKQVGFLGKVVIYPGEDELEALAMGGFRVLMGEEVAQVYE